MIHLPIDHIVYACSDLKVGIEELSDLLEINIQPGGRHEQFGTQNALVNLGSGIYLEILAPDHQNKAVKLPRWMGVDLIDDISRITRIALKSTSIDSDIKNLRPFGVRYLHHGPGNRKTNSGKVLSWNMTYPLPTPLIDPVPFLVEWKGDFHPTLDLSQHVTFSHLDIFTAQTDLELINLYDPNQVKFHLSDTEKIILNIETLKGKVILD